MKKFAALFFIVFLAVARIAEAQAQSRFENPLKFNSISDFVREALRLLVMVSLPIISLFLVYSGFLFVLARGNEEQLQKAKRNFLFVILGSILIMGAWVFATLLGATVTSLVA